MITVKRLRKLLNQIPDDAKVYAYCGEDEGISIYHNDITHWWIRAKESTQRDTCTKGFIKPKIKSKSLYPLCDKYKIPYKKSKLYKFYYCPFKQLDKRLNELNIKSLFIKYFGIQTSSDKGHYTDDVEAILNRIYKNKLTGSQLIWD